MGSYSSSFASGQTPVCTDRPTGECDGWPGSVVISMITTTAAVVYVLLHTHTRPLLYIEAVLPPHSLSTLSLLTVSLPPCLPVLPDQCCLEPHG